MTANQNWDKSKFKSEELRCYGYPSGKRSPYLRRVLDLGVIYIERVVVDHDFFSLNIIAYLNFL